MKKGPKIIIIAAVVLAVAGVLVFLLRGKLFPSAAKADAATTYTIQKVAKDDLSITVAVSGTLEPVSYATIYPDSNMPSYRKLLKLYVKKGDTVREGQLIAEIETSGLDLDLASAKATYESAKVKLANLKAGPTATELAQAESSLKQAQLDLVTQQATYNSTKALVDKNLAAKGDLDSAERSLSLSKLKLEAATLSYNDVKAGSTADVINAQEAAVAQSYNNYLQAKLVYESAAIHAPISGTVTEIFVKVGDLIENNTAMLSIGDLDTMTLQAAVNENDIGQVVIGQKATVTAAGYPEMPLPGTVTLMDMRGTVQGNVSTFKVAIQVPNKDHKLMWGMNADAELAVLSVKGVLTLPTSAVKTSGTGTGTVTIFDEGKPISWDVQLGATDGSKYEILGGLAEGDEVAVVKKATTTTTTTTGNNQRQGGGPAGGMMFFGGRD
ncbi:MAG: efflux RND transporter periplasmic adaptor subunit [Spirochaetes bacterium]|nr:efflux RND transporter periplasmic adaptor subunit [Spirochaetota bacterium]